jgi:hypothetical protein
MARYYDSRTGTFCSADPLAGDPSDPQSWNRYPYGRNDPIDITDPSGQSWWGWLAAFALAPATGGGSLAAYSIHEAGDELANGQPPWALGGLGGDVGIGSSWNGTPENIPNRGIAGALGLPTMADVGGPINNLKNAISPCTPNQRRFFDWLDNPTISGMANHLGTTRTMIFTLAAKEGGWQKDNLDHNIPLNNPFGVNWSDKTGAKGNRNYNLAPFGAGLPDAVSDWENNVHAAQYVQGVKRPEDFANALLTHGYNKNKAPWKKNFLSIAESMPGHMKDCGVKE